MAENKKGFVLYCDLITTIEKLDDKTAGQLLKHIFRYVNDQNPEPESQMIDVVFEQIKNQLKRDLDKWSGIKDKRAEAGKKGGLAKQANARSVKQNLANQAVRVKDTVKVKDTVIYKDYLDLLNSITGKKLRTLNDKIKKQITARLKDGYTIEDFKKAITNCFNDDYHKENPHHLTLEFISRADKFEKWANATPAKHVSPFDYMPRN